ncbi:helix-turn-helix domain-containing protein [Apilactobacillus nanyangensis]|uniref:helix-turn-helix domain-containing protein n=1 Tax=Apilactobacillus nanyangensis TaxID=2799579 RepID=UPI001943570F|nr:helix-turn-helix transcriptional regulator [Apilactobacillus nanyangensis]
MKELSDLIKSKREAKGWSVRNLALNAGMSASYISRLENNKITTKIKVDTLNKLASTLGISRNDIYRAAGYNEVKDNNDLEDMIDSGEYMSFGGKELTEEDKVLIKRLLRK